MNKLSITTTVFTVASLFSVTPSYAQDGPAAGTRMIFAAGYGTSERKMNNYVVIGNYSLSDTTLKADFKEFNANLDAKPKKAGNFHHDLHAPYGKNSCEDKVFDLPSESASRNAAGTWHMDGKTLAITIGSQTYEWEAEADSDDAFVLKRLTDNRQKSELPLAVGFAYIVHSARPEKLVKGNFRTYYDGEIRHKNNHAVAVTPWQFMPTGLKVGDFIEQEDDNVLSYSTAGTAENHGAWVGNGLLLNYDTKWKHAIYQDLGHDFNKNGCYDEYGHNKAMLANYSDEDKLVHQMVFVEYSYAYDGFPLLSVGRYFDDKKKSRMK